MYKHWYRQLKSGHKIQLGDLASEKEANALKAALDEWELLVWDKSIRFHQSIVCRCKYE